MLEKIRPSQEQDQEDEDSFNSLHSRVAFSSPSSAKHVNSLIKNFKKPKDEVEVFEHLRSTSTHFAIQEVQMLMPFNATTLDF